MLLLRTINITSRKQFNLSFQRKAFGIDHNASGDDNMTLHWCADNSFHYFSNCKSSGTRESSKTHLEMKNLDMNGDQSVWTDINDQTDNVNDINVVLTMGNLCCFGEKYIDNKVDKIHNNRQLLIIQYCQRVITLLIAALTFFWGVALINIIESMLDFFPNTIKNQRIKLKMTRIPSMKLYYFKLFVKINTFTTIT